MGRFVTLKKNRVQNIRTLKNWVVWEVPIVFLLFKKRWASLASSLLNCNFKWYVAKKILFMIWKEIGLIPKKNIRLTWWIKVQIDCGNHAFRRFCDSNEDLVSKYHSLIVALIKSPWWNMLDGYKWKKSTNWVFSFMWNLYLKIYFAIAGLVSSRLKVRLDTITTNEAFIGNSVEVV